MTFKKKITLVNALILVVALLVTIVASLREFRTEIDRQAQTFQEIRLKMFWELLLHKGTTFTIVDGKLRVGDYTLNDNFELPDKLKELSGGTATIFMGDTRISTNVLKEDGSRAVGTKLQGVAREAVLTGGKPYRGEADILGERYLTAYDPIKDGQGNVIGVLYVGVKKSVFFAGYDWLKRVLIGITLALIGIGAALSLITTNRLYRHIGSEPAALADLAEKVAYGDLSVLLEPGKSGIHEAMRHMVNSLRGIIATVNDCAQAVAAASVELHVNARNTLDGSHEVVAQATTVATASEEMAVTSADIAKNCHQAAHSSQRAGATAQAGAEVVRATVDGMNRIADKVRNSAGAVEQLGARSDQIGAIVATIEDIADQTNLLALNAAIEAARAGEQGRGFAVVADEVRALAERTTKATREIGEMIKGIQAETRLAVTAMVEGVDEAEQGTAGAARSGEALTQILVEVQEVTQQVNQIATAAEEQTATTHEISHNIQRISDTVKDSTRAADEIAIASSQLAKLSDGLQSLVQKFKL